MALPEPTINVSLGTTSCTTADRYVAETIHMIQEGRQNLEIMSYLDKETPDPKKQPQAYVGVMIVKLNVGAIRVALSKSFKESTIRQKQISDCVEADGKQYATFE
jgi:hypothetical protein